MDVDEVVSSLDDGEVFLVLVDYDNFRKVSNMLTAELLEKGLEGIFFTTDRTFEDVREELDFEGADATSLRFIDVVSKKRGITDADGKVDLVDSPTAFNDINLAFSRFFDDAGPGSFVVLDSFTSYLLYGNLKPIGNFVKKMTDKSRDRESKFFLLAMKTQIDDETIERLMTFCDRKFDLAGEKV